MTSSNLRGLQGASPGRATVVTPPRRRWTTRVLLPGAIMLAVVVLLAVTSARTLLPATPVHVVPVVMKTVEAGGGTVTVQAPGWLEPDPHPTYVAALADGVVAAVDVLEGDHVEAGQIMAHLVDDDARLTHDRTQAVVAQRRAELRFAEADLEAADADLKYLIERTRLVEVAEATVRAAEAGLAQGRAEVAVAKARRAEVADELDRKSKLTESQAVSLATVARLRLRLEAEVAMVNAAAAQVAVLEAKVTEAEAGRRAAEQDRTLLIVERRTRARAAARVAEAEAAVSLAEVTKAEAALQLERMSVRAPVAGIVMRRLTSPGSKVTTQGDEYSAHVVHLYDPAHLQVRVDVPLADAGHISVGQPAEVTVEVLPDRTFTGRVSRIVHEADIQKNTIEVKVAIDTPSAILTPEMLARVRFLASAAGGAATARARLFAPRSLVRADDDGSASVLVVTDREADRGRIDRRGVTLGSREMDGWVEVESGLQPGDLLVADPDPSLAAGDRVRVVGERTGGG